MRNLESRVDVYSVAGKWVESVSPYAALQRIAQGGHIRRLRKGKVSAIQLSPEGPGKPTGPPSKPSLTQYMGQRYTRREAVGSDGQMSGHCISFRSIHPDDRGLFCLSVTDCLVDEPTEFTGPSRSSNARG